MTAVHHEPGFAHKACDCGDCPRWYVGELLHRRQLICAGALTGISSFDIPPKPEVEPRKGENMIQHIYRQFEAMADLRALQCQQSWGFCDCILSPRHEGVCRCRLGHTPKVKRARRTAVAA